MTRQDTDIFGSSRANGKEKIKKSSRVGSGNLPRVGSGLKSRVDLIAALQNGRFRDPRGDKKSLVAISPNPKKVVNFEVSKKNRQKSLVLR